MSSSNIFFLLRKYNSIVLLICASINFISCSKESTSPSNGIGGSNGGGVTTPPTVTDPDSYFIDEFQIFNTGVSWVQQFTISGSQKFVLRCASTYTADFAVFAPSQLANFQNNQGFTAFLLFDNQFGTGTITLSPGTYYVGLRNQSNVTNRARIELDKANTLPASDKTTFYDNYLDFAVTVSPNNGYYAAPFTINQGYRYFTDGCNSGSIEYWVIPASEINNFTSNSNLFQYFSPYHAYSTAEPGSHSMTLPPGNYYYVFRNTGTTTQSLTFRCERWKVN